MALDDPTPTPQPSSDSWQKWIHGEVMALKAWAASAKYPWSDNIHSQAHATEEPVASTEEPAPVVAPPAQDPSVEGVG